MNGLLTHDGYPARKNKDGSFSTEVSVTVTDPRLNNGRPTNIPSMWQGVDVPEDAAILFALDSGKQYPSFDTIDAAVKAAQARSNAKGKQSGGLMDFFQAASNAAADTVAAPVDLLSMLLGKMGVNVGEAVGGSDWMKRKGLKKDVPQSAQSLAGETVGLLSPVVAAAKAPQIARGLLQAGDNLAAPNTMGSQRGAIVWHGSPHKFDKFDSSKIGTGEGAQAYGHGLYLADSPGVAESYAKVLPQRKAMDPDWWADKNLPEFLTVDEQRTLNAIKEKLARSVYGGKNPTPEELATFRSLQDRYSAYNDAVEAAKPTGNIYKVYLPDDQLPRMLDWDKNLSDQQQLVKAIKKAFSSVGMKSNHYDIGKLNGGHVHDGFRRATGSAAKASEVMREAGIPGIRYLDGGSRGAGAGTYNYVVFPGEEGLLKILERNGQSLLP